MHSVIQDMKNYLQTGFGESKVNAESTEGKKTQGCQGNGVVPAGQTGTIIVMLKVHKKKNHVIHLFCPITKKTPSTWRGLYLSMTASVKPSQRLTRLCIISSTTGGTF